ncbi:ribonuclease III [Candidatus Curtissbacteria bacterium RBG_13_35_7]|uniref:Ribonuclease 3 n=1 Tax=Candidatus Curtissbacteria bacterium RBG_13_35_7 TaxID=1797705 RepID=A0A1F5G1R3_9BACT|nr:MAG: ribonuclease III [Candidatus Curtissbacteria bacterium RBG_13_35_7]
MPTLQIKKSPVQNPLHTLESAIKIQFNNQNLLKNAFIHRSYLNEHKKYKGDSNERLEFLGDAVLSTVVSRFLFLNLPTSPEGELTQIRAALVRTETLAKIAQNLHLGNYLYLSKGEEDSHGRTNNSTLANTYEALIGAIYLDQGLAQTDKFIQSTILKNWKKLAQSAVSDNKSKLQEIMQRKYKISPTYKLLSSWGPDHARQFEIGVYMNEKLLAKGNGKNKQQAAQNAAKLAITAL